MSEILDLKTCFRIFDGKESDWSIDLVKKVNMPICGALEQLETAVNANNCQMFKVRKELMNTFLKRHFCVEDIKELMFTYSSLHNGFALAQEPPESIYCFFGNEKDSDTLRDLLARYQHSVGVMSNGVTTFLNLHTDDIYKLSIIRADFDLNTFNYDFLGVHHKTDDFHFFLYSSPQLDITIVYNDLKGNKGAV